MALAYGGNKFIGVAVRVLMKRIGWIYETLRHLFPRSTSLSHAPAIESRRGV